MRIDKVGLLYHPLNGAAGDQAGRLGDFLEAQGVAVWLCSAWESERIDACLGGTDLLITVGGDGTILRAAQAAMHGDAAIVGINMGKLGFMTELSTEGVEANLVRLLAGEGWVDERATLTVQYGERTYFALNDVVVARGVVARTVTVEVEINGERLTAYRADGVVVATATGSTGYTLAAGGPILPPRATELVMAPVVPHVSSGYALVLTADSTVDLRVATAQEATFCVDGHINLPMAVGDRITVRSGARKIKFLRIHPEKFYGSLEERLKGKK